MNSFHSPIIDSRYWAAITLASVFGTNLGDFYAHESGLGTIPGVALLVAIVMAILFVERVDGKVHEAWYWLVILIIRTGATNIADYLAFRIRIPAPALTLGLAALLAGFAWNSARGSRARGADGSSGLPDTNPSYWAAMLSAGVFGTVVGDICSHAIGKGYASLGLGFVLVAFLFARRSSVLAAIAAYWLTVAAARTAGTAIGDWIAENKILNIGLPLSTLMTGAAFVLVLLLWRSRGLGGRERLNAA